MDQIPTESQTGVRTGAAALGAIWLVFLLLGAVAYCTRQGSTPSSDLSGRPAQAGSSAPRARFFKDHVEIAVASSTSGFAVLRCVVGKGRFRDCSVTRASNDDKAEEGRYFAMQLAVPEAGPTAPAVGSRLTVDVNFNGV